MAQSHALVPKRPLGHTGIEVSSMGLGGYHLGEIQEQAKVDRIVNESLDAGINFFDNAWEYHDGRSEELMGKALQGKRDLAIVMTKVCTHGRKKDVAMRQLEESLVRLKTDHIDVWQIHEVIYWNDPDLIFAPDGAAEALVEAKKQGKVRFVGFTGHKDPGIHLKMLSHNFPFDTVQMPLNCFDATYSSFEAAGAAGAEQERHRAAGHEELRRMWGDVEQRRCDAGGSAPLCDESSGGGDHQRRRDARGAASESRGGARLSADRKLRHARAARALPQIRRRWASGAVQDDHEIRRANRTRAARASDGKP